MRFRERIGSPIRKKRSNAVLKSRFQSLKPAARPLDPAAADDVSDAAGDDAERLGTSGRPGIAPPRASTPPGREAGTEVATEPLGVNRIFTKGEIMPIEIPLVSAKPTMSAAVPTSLPR